MKDDRYTPHPCGVYPQDIDQDPITKLAAIPYDIAENLGFMKLDFLHLSVYKHFKSHDEVCQLVNIDPNWQLLQMPSVVDKLFQLSKHFEVVSKIKPKSVEELADVIALIRPGKRQLVDAYIKNKDVTRRILYTKGSGEYAFKRSHACAYSMVIILQLHLIEAGMPLDEM